MSEQKEQVGMCESCEKPILEGDVHTVDREGIRVCLACGGDPSLPSAQYFSHDPNGEFLFHDTPEEAKAAAESSLAHAIFHAEDSDFSWYENEQDICWGRVLGRVNYNDRELTPEEKAENPPYDYHRAPTLDDVTADSITLDHLQKIILNMKETSFWSVVGFVDKPEGQEQDEEGVGKRWVNQHPGGGLSGDDFSGHIFFPMCGRFLKVWYAS